MKVSAVIVMIFAFSASAALGSTKAELATGANLFQGASQDVLIIVKSGKYRGCFITGKADPMFAVSRVTFELSEMSCEKDYKSLTYNVRDWKVLDGDNVNGVKVQHVVPDAAKQAKNDKLIESWKKLPMGEDILRDAIQQLQNAKYGYLNLKKGATVLLGMVSEPKLIQSVPRGNDELILYPKK